MKLVETEVAFVLNSDIEVYGSWQTDILKAFDAYSRVGTVSTLTNAGSILSTPVRNTSIPNLPTPALRKVFARLVKTVSKSSFPIIVTPVGHLFAVDLQVWRKLGGFSMEFSPGYGEEVDFGERTILIGFKNVLADSVWVSHKNGSSFGNSSEVKQMRIAHERSIQEKHHTFLQRSSIEATSELTPLAKCLKTIQNHLIQGSAISKDPFFATKDFSALQEYLSSTYFPDIKPIGEELYLDFLNRTGGDYFNPEARVFFISSVENYYNPFRSMTDANFESKVMDFHKNLSHSRYIVLASNTDLKFLRGLYDIDPSQIVFLPKLETGKHISSRIKFEDMEIDGEKPTNLFRIEYFDYCDKECEILFCEHVFTGLSSEIFSNILFAFPGSRLKHLDIYGSKLSFVKSRVIGGKFEKKFIPLNSRRRNFAKRVLHKAVRIYSAGLKR